MKKSLIALAVASAVSAPAFAATSNVDVYGKMHFAVSLFNDQADAVSDLQFSSAASRIGFKGSEDLGGGLSAIWQIESGVNIDEGNGTWASRNTFVGLTGGFGTVLGGKHDTPLKLVGRSVDLFGDTMADSRNVMGGGSDTRANNVVAYISPSFSGFNVAVAYVTDLGISTGPLDPVPGVERDNYDVYNLNATYTNGPLFLGAAYGDGDGHEQLGIGAHYRLAGGYTFGNFKVVAQYDNLEDDDSVTPATLPGDYDAWMVGASYNMGAMVFKANYMEGEYDVTNSDADPEQWAIGVDYNLSKRTSVYALYADGTNITLGSGAGLTDQVPGQAVTGDDDVSVVSIGLVHSF